MAEEALPRVNLKIPRTNQDTFLGRLQHFLAVTDMRTLLVSKQQMEAELKLLHEYEVLGINHPMDQLWKAKKHRDALIHPDTGNIIPIPYRVSAFVPANIVIIIGLLNPQTSILSTLFWQWANQTYNVVMNYGNRNASSTMSSSKLMMCYGAAVTSAGGIAMGLNQLLDKAKHANPKMKGFLSLFVPFIAVSIAGVLNVGLMRSPELVEGVSIFDVETQEDLGKSITAGKTAVGQTAITRIATSGILLACPPLAYQMVESTGIFEKRPKWKTPIRVGFIGFFLWIGLPFSLALFPQNPRVHVDSLEPSFRNRTNANGNPITYVTYNKGM